MPLEFSIVGGYITMPKEIFIREILNKDSIIRTLLKWTDTGSFKDKHPMIDENHEYGNITINFTGIDCVSIGDDPDKLLTRLKARYKEKIKGWVAVRGTYEMMNTTFNIRLNLNCDEGKVEYF